MPQPGKAVRGVLPCGNPNRYTSAEVVRFKGQQKLSQGNVGEDQSESDQYIQKLLKRQINKDVSLKEQFANHRNFIGSSSHAPSVSGLNGLHKASEHVRLDEYDTAVEYLKSCDLSDKEICFVLKNKFPEKFETSSGRYGTDPLISQLVQDEIERKLTEKQKALSQPDKFNGGLELSRQAYVLEKSVLQKQSKESNLPEFLFKRQKTATDHLDDPVNHIDDILSEIDSKPDRLPRRDRRKLRKLNRKLIRQQGYIEADSNLVNHHETISCIPPDENTQLDPTTYIESDNTEKNIPTNGLSRSNSEGVSCDTIFQHKTDTNESIDSANEDLEVPPKAKRKKKSADSFTSRDFSGNMQFVTDEEIKGNKLGLEEILKMQKFENYAPGNPSQTMFVKNLPNYVTDIDLLSLFGRYEYDITTPISYRLLNGRMKGQAFITFPDIETCRQAITALNGYKFGGKPMILSFGKQ